MPDGPEKTRIINQLVGQTGRRVLSSHDRFDSDGNKVGDGLSWGIDERESSGTQKAIHLSGPIVFALKTGATLFIDEIEAKMHTKLTTGILSLFLAPNINRNGAQVIFTTHDTNLLNSLSLRRDQVYFIEKGKSDSSELYSLSDIVYADGKKERKETDWERKYLEDRYGATPEINIDASKFLAI
jgi:AAA15 family ATPase/GTPase